MSAYLLLWNPKRWLWQGLADEAHQTAIGTPVRRPWSCGTTRRMQAGDRVFLMKLGSEPPRGIMAVGRAVSNEAIEQPHYDPDEAALGAQTRYVDISFERILDPNKEAILVEDRLNEEFPDMRWNPRRSGIEIPEDVAAALERVWEQHLAAIQNTLPST